MLIDQHNAVITPLTFLTVDSCFHSLSILPHQAMWLTSSCCVHSLMSVLWLPVTKRVLGMGERCFLCPGMHRSAKPLPYAPVPIGSPAGSLSTDVELWVTPEQEKLSEGGQGGADTRLFYCLNRAGGRTQMAPR